LLFGSGIGTQQILLKDTLSYRRDLGNNQSNLAFSAQIQPLDSSGSGAPTRLIRGSRVCVAEAFDRRKRFTARMSNVRPPRTNEKRLVPL
jgi:hypothetical protein